MQKIMLAHGGGGQEMNDLINGLIFKIFNNEILSQNNDSAILNLSGKLAFSTDSFVVSPTKFLGGDIGKIAVCGTANDLAMVGAKPRYISCALIIEEGFDINELKDILSSMKSTADEAGVAIVCGDTKVVSKGSCDKIFINTSGVGEIIKEVRIENLKSGAKILLSGDVGRHGAVVLASRNELRLQSDLQSDCKPLYKIVEALLNAGIAPLAMRDATRGGLSAVLNEWAKACGRDIKIIQDSIAVSDEVMGICEILGFEPYELANEGTFLLAVEPKDEIRAVEILKEFNSNANSIGEILDSNKSNVIIQNSYGATRFMELPKGELLPRIC
ncbi:hydrogenase expression/formation protein HypE [Campylobacter hyointestinalis]|uniref:hydrogenase expression/formation protein HypE n=1 Tax=Campylobacter hyointestinalis TaxID=198 RepID=UPI0004DAB1F3|nr:hydrogenase expression/formation protein HypE [Campylobacter hyointestinalis]ANE32632.1 hydrogenase expression/formation protein HypE [Campylobacter hyointestinalis subsp. hyointestinalis LMG 9260]KEA45031.1 hydrogenase assembly protein HupF [Campylobacter hyointestinalis subsp. hyointestinalis]QKF55802.1 hydrogenase expression/formation protein HypE [Campylobacter hyointestinalis subsp. hyointestinalis]TXK48371.1 hydrogenase expression/formation protein HypE [Campylobacter hyointestinalis]